MAESKDQLEHEGGWYKPEGSSTPIAIDTTENKPTHQQPKDSEAIEWTASEFIAHDKGIGWYVVLGLATLLITSIVYLVTHDMINVFVLLLLGILIGVTASRPPRIVSYRLDRGGLTIGQTFHPFGLFKSYAIISEGAFASITLLPLRRFDFPINIYYSPEDEQKIMAVLSKYLPAQQGSLDAVDRLMRTLHF